MTASRRRFLKSMAALPGAASLAPGMLSFQTVVIIETLGIN